MKSAKFISCFAFLLISACGALPLQDRHPTPSLMPGMAQGRSAAKLDSATPSQAKAALAPAASGRLLGRAVVGLGSPAEAGFWVQSALIHRAGKGRVVSASGASVSVDLLPTTGAASLSFSAFRALGFALTDLPEVMIYDR